MRLQSRKMGNGPEPYTPFHSTPPPPDPRLDLVRVVWRYQGVTGKQLMVGALTTTIPNAGIIAFSKLMAGELGPHGITVNNICPGFTKVESWGPRAEAMAKVRNVTADQVRAGIASQTLLGRWAEPEEIGNVAAFLVSNRNGYMTGTTVEVCGGFNRYI